MESYRTVKQETSAEFIEKRSKFIGYIKPVQTRGRGHCVYSEYQIEALGRYA